MTQQGPNADKRIGWVPQQTAIYASSPSRRTCACSRGLEGVEDPDATVERMLEQTGLQERADDELASLSGGNRQRVNIAVGLLADPPVLLLDEPSGALDPRQRQRLWTFIRGLTERGTSVVFCTHDISEAERHGDRVLVLADGELLFDGTPAELKAAATRAARARTSSRRSSTSCASEATDMPMRWISSRTSRSCGARSCSSGC